MRRAAIYVRISKDRAGGGLGVARQEKDCRELAARLGWEVVALHSDNDLSAYSGKPRPGYRALLDDLDTGHANAVLAWHTDRLHRSPRELESFVDLCERRDVTTHTVTAGELDLSTPAGRAVARTLGAWARYEVEQGVKRQKAAKQQAASSGKWLGGPRPFGWTTSGALVPEEAEAIRHWTTSILAGVSVASLTRQANNNGLATSTGKQWTATEVRRVVTRARNAGLVEHRGAVLDGVDSGWPAIVPVDEWRAVTAMVLDPARRTNPSPARRHLGSGLYLCGRCANGTTLTSGTGDQGTRYRCKAHHHLSRLAAPLDDFVLAVVRERLSAPDVSDLLAVGVEDDVPDRLAAATAARERMTQLAEEFGAGRLSLAAFTAGTAAATQVVEAHEREQAARAAGSAFAGVLDAPDPVEALQTLIDAARADEGAGALGRLRTLVSALLEVTVMPQHRGRPKGWKKGDIAFDPTTIHVRWLN